MFVDFDGFGDSGVIFIFVLFLGVGRKFFGRRLVFNFVGVFFWGVVVIFGNLWC